MPLLTRLERLRALRDAITAANMRAITPDCCGRPMLCTWSEVGEADGDAFGFRCGVCEAESCVELPCRLAHAHTVLAGAR